MKESVTVLISEEAVQDRVSEIAKAIEAEYKGKRLTLVCVLKGGVIFMVDLARKINEANVEFDFMDISSYGDSTVSSGTIKINKDLENTIDGKDVILVEDIIDSGRTLSHIVKHLKTQNPNSLRICALLDKPDRREVFDVAPDYIGFSIPDEFVVGYGLDYAQRYRNLPFIGILHLSDEN